MQITQQSVGLRSERGPVLLSIMLSVGLVAIDSTILATAVPSIVNDLGGFAQFPWLFSIYLLAQAVTVPIYGKLSDLFGRKPVILFGIAAFLIGSVLCGFAWSMTTLIAARAIQGLGAGAVQPTSMTMIGDLYTVSERARVQGYVASVWAISAVVGPTLGGVFSEFLTWRWIFFVNVPLGGIAAWMIIRRFHEKVEKKQHRIDFTGASLLAVGSSLIILGLLEGGVLWAWDSWVSIAILAGGVGLLVLFTFVERRAAEPVLPGWIFKRRLLNSTSLASMAVGVMVIGLTSYVPLFVQGVLHTGALVAGFALAALTVGWPLSAALAGKVYLRIGFRNTALIGSGIVLAGAALLLLLSAQSTVWQVGATCFVVGLGMGMVASPTLVAAQSTVDWQSRGVVTGTNMFARSMGSAVGIAVFGAIANAALASRVSGHASGTASGVPASALAPAMHEVFLAAAVVAIMLLGAIALMPRKISVAD